MVERLVLDASAALAILRAEPQAGRIQRLLAAPEVQEILVPDHFWLEVTNVLVRRYSHTAMEVAEAIENLDEIRLRTIPIDRPLLLLALDGMAAKGLSAYDAAYLALADVAEADLVTLDLRLGVAAGSRDALGAEGIDHRTTEARGVYGSGGALATLAGFGAYLARLREAWAAGPR